MFKDISVNPATLKNPIIFYVIMLKSHYLSYPYIKAASFQSFSLLLHSSLSCYSFPVTASFLLLTSWLSSPQPNTLPASLTSANSLQLKCLESTCQPHCSVYDEIVLCSKSHLSYCHSKLVGSW